MHLGAIFLQSFVDKKSGDISISIFQEIKERLVLKCKELENRILIPLLILKGTFNFLFLFFVVHKLWKGLVEAV